MNIASIESLFLEQREITEEEANQDRERLANLKNDPALKRLHKMKKVDSIIKILSCLEERKFEQAYSFFKLFEAISEYEDVMSEAELHTESKEERSSFDVVKH